MTMRWVQKKIDGEWKLIPITEFRQDQAVGGIVIMEDIKPFMAFASEEPTLIGSRSALRKYMANNNLVQYEAGMHQDNERNNAASEANNRRALKQTLIDVVNR